MIIENMSIEEMQLEVEKDADILYAKIKHLYNENRRFFIKSTRFPVYKTFKWTSRITSNKWDIIILARDKKEVTHPGIVPYVKYQSYGTGVVYMRPIDNRILTIVYTPHLFSRYRERFLGDSGSHFSTDEVIHHLFVNSSIPTYNFESAENKVIIHIEQGLILGDYNEDRTRLLAKTFVSKEMLFNSQVSLDNDVVEMRRLVKKSAEYNADPRMSFGMDRLTGEIITKVGYFEPLNKLK